MGAGVAVIGSARVRPEGDYPQDSDYRERNDFFYLTGLEAPGAWLVLSAGVNDKREVRLYLPPRNPGEERWTGVQLGPGPEAARLTGIADVRSSEAAATDIRGLLRAMIVPGSGMAAWLEGAAEADCARPCLPFADSAQAATGRVRDAGELTAGLRLVKDADELRRLRRAATITADAQRVAMQAIEPGLFEYEIEAAIEYTFRREGAERVAFPSIIGSGPNSTVLHYDRNRRRIEDGDLAVVDIGAEYGYYSADVTRTMPASGRFSPRQRAIYDLVLGAQQTAIDSVRPGMSIPQLEQIARKYIDRHSGTLCGGPSCSRWFVHGLSHWLGMDVHDVGDYGRALVPGMVLTVEPGIYLSDEALGVRIEDDVLVTATGAEVLSAAAPRTADEIEKLIAEARRVRAGAPER